MDLMARSATAWLQAIALFVLAAIALAALTYTIAASMGAAPWLVAPLAFGDTIIPAGGMYLQITVTALLVGLMFFVPSAMRTMRLETSHRNFALKMEDVARAYHHVHAADRAGIFTLSSEFDAVRERIAFLRDHPDLQELEADVIEVAAQMGQTSRHLAEVYSDDKIARAKAFLAERQEEIERQQEMIVKAQQTARELRRWGDQIHLEESVVASQLERLTAELDEILPELGLIRDGSETNVVRMAKPAE
ncbi:DNA repair protein [Aestuariibius sp. 2305UL40-4]|uniref:DNA repair protein n=1 Tax=Aestuariibius violaceus TaxID=3234132 RepID=UPI003497CA98